MKSITKQVNLFSIALIILLVLAACSNEATVAVSTKIPPETLVPSSTTTLTNTSQPTHTLTPTATITNTPTIIKATPIPELNESLVGIIWDLDLKGIRLMPCYVFTPTIFHAGDIVYFPNGLANTTYNVKAPADGRIAHANYINSSVGFDIAVRTPYTFNGDIVFYDVIHTSGLVGGLRVGDYVKKGDNLAIKDGKIVDPAGWWLVDLAFRTGNEQANASLSGWTGLGYLSYSKLISDDLAKLPYGQVAMMPTCPGNPIEQNKPYITPTPNKLGPNLPNQ